MEAKVCVVPKRSGGSVNGQWVLVVKRGFAVVSATTNRDGVDHWTLRERAMTCATSGGRAKHSDRSGVRDSVKGENGLAPLIG